jgi:hypothetical protein
MGRRLVDLLLLCALGLAGQEGAPQDDVILRAMRDELRRSDSLQLQNLKAPYYVEYALHDGESVTISATLGALLSSRRNRFRQPRVQVRVGSYQFDNSNYVLSDAFFGIRYRLGQPPLDDIYGVLRHYFWLTTDRAYKSALEAIARKRAALKNFNVSERLNDFAKAEPSRTVFPAESQSVDEELWKGRLRRLSEIFAGYPQVSGSSVEFQAVQSTFYFVNTEGTEARVGEKMMYVQVKATAQAPDGMILRDATVFQTREFDQVPPEPEMARGVRGVAENLTALARAPQGEPYTGPVLFEAKAAAQLIAEVLGRNLSLRRRPVSQPGRPILFPESELEGRLGSRTLPEWMDVVDDPTQKEWRGRPLFGHYLVDLEGMAPKPLELVTKGVLTGFLLTRQPVRGFGGSNGRARLPGNFGAKAAGFGNLFVRAGETVALDELRNKMLDLCRQRNKPHGIIVRKMDFPSSASLQELRRLTARIARAAGGGRPVSLPILVYRLYADGKEELIRGLRFRDLTTRSLRDIIAASDEEHLFDFLNNAAPFALMGAGGFVAESSVIAPALLFDELQLERLEEELPKPPVVPPPTLETAG